ncbi:MAG TPA: ATP-binding protein [Actinomycetota bacterium]|nr:ATP-binding protein [Actinomycetota bacterium]
MTQETELRKLEGWMTYLRWGATLAGAIAFSLRTYPSERDQAYAWDAIVLLALGSLVIWGLNASVSSDADHRKLGFGAFIFDGVVIAAIVWVFAWETPYVTWGLLLLLPLEGAARYGARGAGGAAGAASLFFVLQSLRVADLRGEGFDYATLVFVVSLLAIVAAASGAMVEHLSGRARSAVTRSEQLQEFDKMKDRFIAVTSHEIRGPLTAIIAGVDTVRKKGDRLSPEQNEHLLAMVQQQGGQLARLVDDLLVTSQLQTGTIALDPMWGDLESVVREALDAAAGKRRTHHLEVFIEPLECELDRARLGQIIRNLVENAYKYTPDDSTVRVTGSRSEDGIAIEVSDDGEGIPQNKRDQLFDAFSRIAETSAGRDGVGLGLYVVSHLTAAMGGRIDLRSSSRGTTFVIDLPCDARPPHAVPKLGIVESPGG